MRLAAAAATPAAVVPAAAADDCVASAAAWSAACRTSASSSCSAANAAAHRCERLPSLLILAANPLQSPLISSRDADTGPWHDHGAESIAMGWTRRGLLQAVENLMVVHQRPSRRGALSPRRCAPRPHSPWRSRPLPGSSSGWPPAGCNNAAQRHRGQKDRGQKGGRDRTLEGSPLWTVRALLHKSSSPVTNHSTDAKAPAACVAVSRVLCHGSAVQWLCPALPSPPPLHPRPFAPRAQRRTSSRSARSSFCSAAICSSSSAAACTSNTC